VHAGSFDNVEKVQLGIDMINSLEPDLIVFTGDLVHSKNQMTPELIQMVSWVLSECSKIAKTILIIGNHISDHPNPGL
jgi:predicted MPP superfamily phosphohydrolase